MSSYQPALDYGKPKPQKQPTSFVYHNLAECFSGNLFGIGKQFDLHFPTPKTLDEFLETVFHDGRKLKHWQAENMLFFRDLAEFRGICADDTGLGKTITACGLIHNFPEKVLPAVIFCKTTLKQSWWFELFSTTDIVPQIIEDGNDVVKDDSQIVICSYDLLKKQMDSMEYWHPRMVVMDECQKIKNWNSKRTQAMVEYCKDVPYIIGLSADPISNNAMEYFPFLHITRPERFADQKHFARYVGLMDNGSGGYRLGGIAEYMMDRWRKMTHDTIIRHKREDVAPYLPTITRSHRYIKLTDSKAIEALLEITKKFVAAKEAKDEGVAGAANEANTSLMRMRHILGDAKVPFALDYIEEFLNEGDPTRKLTLFVHHKSVATALLAGIEEMREKREITCNPPFVIRGGMNEKERNDLIAACTSNGGWPTNDPFDRLLVASTLAAGEGINLQKCYDYCMVERQFNPPNEEQAEGRFPRIGIDESIKSIFGVYLTMMDSLDSWFQRLNTGKKTELVRTHGDKESYGPQWGSEDEILQSLEDVAYDEGKKWIKKMNRMKTKRKPKHSEED